MKRLFLFIVVAITAYFLISMYCIFLALGERIRYIELLGRGYGYGLMVKCDEDKNYRSKNPEYFIDYPNSDNEWYGYKLVIKEGVRPSEVPKEAEIAAFLPTKSLPWWIWFRPSNKVLVCYGDSHVEVVNSGEVDFKL